MTYPSIETLPRINWDSCMQWSKEHEYQCTNRNRAFDTAYNFIRDYLKTGLILWDECPIDEGYPEYLATWWSEQTFQLFAICERIGVDVHALTLEINKGS